MVGKQIGILQPCRFLVVASRLNKAQEASFKINKTKRKRRRKKCNQQGLADTYAGMQDFQGIGMQLDQQIDNLGKGLSQGQQQIQQQIAQMNGQNTVIMVSISKVLVVNGLGNLETRRSYGN